jgi:hypothetical protein
VVSGIARVAQQLRQLGDVGGDARASSRVSGMDAARRDARLSVIGKEAEVRDLRLKRR